MDSDELGDSTAAPEPLGQRCAFPTLTTADGAQEVSTGMSAPECRAFGAEPDISTWGNYPTSLLCFDTAPRGAERQGRGLAIAWEDGGRWTGKTVVCPVLG